MKFDNLNPNFLENIGPEGLSNLIQISTSINSSLDLDEVLAQVMDLTNELLNAEASSLLLLKGPDNKLIFTTTTGKKAQEIKEFTLDMGQGIAGWVAHNGKPLIVPEVMNDPRHYREPGEVMGFETRSLICVPMKVKDAVIGVIEVMNRQGPEPFSADDLPLLTAIANQAAIAVQNAQVHSELRKRTDELRSEIVPDIIGNSPEMIKIYAIVEKVAKGDSTLLIRGKSGTGKELLARAIHIKSPKKNRPFVSVTCSILSQTLLESELFGHEKGAYTGADSQKIGRFEFANGGTLFLDEIGTLSQETQIRLLRVLQDKEFERVGGTETIKVDVRIMAATNEDLEKAIEEGKFREDLYYRLKVIEISLPDLKNRPEDILPLAEFYLKKMAEKAGREINGFAPETIKLIKAYPWPGNVRELKNTIERTVVLGNDKIIGIEDLPEEIRYLKTRNSKKDARDLSLTAAEKEHILYVLEQTNWNKSKAAGLLNISRNRLDRKLATYNIDNPIF
ncbi:MAG: sigma 54-interacting transcriptional regulator [Candidatus Theseobacter exili]|nr:sigma 54-interacting transcriptional regulator [Candidatus Theseobacter exili]